MGNLTALYRSQKSSSWTKKQIVMKYTMKTFLIKYTDLFSLWYLLVTWLLLGRNAFNNFITWPACDEENKFDFLRIEITKTCLLCIILLLVTTTAIKLHEEFVFQSTHVATWILKDGHIFPFLFYMVYSIVCNTHTRTTVKTLLMMSS